jgi:hypothetical protein
MVDQKLICGLTMQANNIFPISLLNLFVVNIVLILWKNGFPKKSRWTPQKKIILE